MQATGALLTPYQYTQGSDVLDSFSMDTYPGDVNPMRDYGTAAARAAMEIALLKGASKLAEGKSLLLMGEKAGAKEAGEAVATKGPDAALPWTTSEGVYSNKLPAGYNRGPVSVDGKAVDGATDFGLGAKGAASEGLEATNNSLPTNSSQLSHIFRDDVGHLMDTPENQQALVNLTNNPANRLGTDRFGNQWFAQIQSDGSQLWGSVRNGVVQNGGLNTTPRNFNPATGLSKGK